MMSIVDAVATTVESICTVSGDLIKGDCAIVVNLPPKKRIALDFDHPKSPLTSNEVRCDFLFVSESEGVGYVVPLELSTNPNKDIDQALRQLQAGACYAQSKIRTGEGICFIPSLVTETLRKFPRKLLKRSDKKVQFHKHRRQIIRFPCGVSISTILKKRRRVKRHK